MATKKLDPPPDTPLEQLGLSEEDWVAGRRSRKISYDRNGYLEIWVFRKEVRQVLRGTLVVRGRIVPGYPRIGRAYHLPNALARNLPVPFVVEEKVDGYNCRLFCIDGQLVGTTRGGYICPYTMDRAPDWIDVDAVFGAHPDLVVFGEVAGPESPYSEVGPPSVAEDVAFFGFDAAYQGQVAFLPARERHQLFDQLGISQVQQFGPFEDPQDPLIEQALASLTELGAEGAVFKPAGAIPTELRDEVPSLRPSRPWLGGRCFKFVPASTLVSDLSLGARLMMDLHYGYFSQRLQKLGVLHATPGRSFDHLAAKVGQALMGPLADTVRRVSDGELLVHRYHCRVNREDTIRPMLRSFGQAPGTNARLLHSEHDGRHFRVSFERVYYRATRIIRNYLEGRLYFD